MFSVDDDVVPSFPPPPRFIRAPCSYSNILLVSSLFSSHMPPLCSFLCIYPTPSSVWSPPRPSPIVRPSERYQPSGFSRQMASSGFPTHRLICRFVPPPRPVRLVVLGLGVGGGAKETAPPAMVLSLSSRLSSPGKACLRRRSTSLSIPAVPVSLSAPPCFPDPASHMQVCTPPRPVRLVVLGLGVGGGAKETAPPRWS